MALSIITATGASAACLFADLHSQLGWQGCDLRGANLSGMDLGGANLSRAKLESLMNGLPRKTLRWRTPTEATAEELAIESTVALQT
jgi:hypothetical protein